MNELSHPIAALATPRAKSALAIIRITGDSCITLFEPFILRNPSSPTIATPAPTSIPANIMRLCKIINPKNKMLLDEAMVTFFKAPHSYTGQDSIELSLHGSTIGIDLLLQALYANGFKPAEPGEFTLRAFLNGKLDLTQAESINAIIDAKTAEAHSLALLQLSGSITKFIDTIKTSLSHMAAICTVSLDYPDDEIQESTLIEPDTVTKLISMLETAIQSYELSKIYREGAIMILTGCTNAGKSSLFNALLKEERAIVSEIPGTTRDYLESQVSLKGIPIRIYDTAGLRDGTADTIEKEGMQRSQMLIDNADIILYVIDANVGIHEQDQCNLKAIIKTIFADIILDNTKNTQAQDANLITKKLFIVWNKIDMPHSKPIPDKCTIRLDNGTAYTIPSSQFIAVSANQYQHIDTLQQCVYNYLSKMTIQLSEDLTVISSLRQKNNLVECKEYLLQVQEGLVNNLPLDMISLDIDAALKAIGNITGEVSNDEILHIVFSNFCLGK